jgi:hypothetical protein
MNTTDLLERITELLGEIAKTAVIMTIAAKLSSAINEDEKMYLAQALAMAMTGDGAIRPNNPMPGQPGYPHSPQFP